MEPIQQLMECRIDACETFRVGITVNSAFLILGVLILIMMHVALTAQDKIGVAVKKEIRGQFIHSGYSLYLVAGCAFFGAFPFSNILLRDHALFAAIWLLGLFLLLLIEMTRARLSDYTTEFSISRILAIPTSLFVIYWVWVGADWPVKG